ncbi:cytochrome P450 [Roseobacter ponti]|uniref:Cytochrome P450 n=2 Tax=Roseobacter ponti TaxID=1891787 RepID=A0A858SY98_9RHOB|nr:cytochrome P450 [Roseobacter ponti]
MVNLADPPPGFATDPFPVYDDLLASARVCPQPDGSYVISGHADLSVIYRDTSLYISDKKSVFGPRFGEDSALYRHHTTSLVFNDPPLHSRVRRIMSSALAPKAIARMEPGLETSVHRLLGELPVRPDLISDFAARIPIEVIGNLLDIPPSERSPLRDWSLAILGALEPVTSTEQQASGNAAVTEFSAFLKDLIARRRQTPGDPQTDVLTRLIAGETDGLLSEEELVQNCIFILNAGHETTTNLIGNGLALLCDDESARHDLRAAPDRIDGFVEEVLRFRSPNQFGNRQTTKAVSFGGQSIPAGANLHLCIGAANRDPEVFKAPGRFDMTRSPNRHLAFAAGPHVCIGLTLARLEARIALVRFLERFPRFAVTRRVPGGRIRFHGFTELRADLSER